MTAGPRDTTTATEESRGTSVPGAGVIDTIWLAGTVGLNSSVRAGTSRSCWSNTAYWSNVAPGGRDGTSRGDGPCETVRSTTVPRGSAAGSGDTPSAARATTDSAATFSSKAR